MTSQPALPFPPTGEGTPIGAAAHLVEDEQGGQVFIHGLLSFVWDASDQESRRYAAVNLLTLRAASAARIAASFSVSPATLWRWKSLATSSGVAGLISDKRGPQGNSKLTDELITQIHALKRTGLSNRAAGQAAGVSEFSVRRALKLDPTTGKTPEPTPTAAPVSMHEAETPAQEQLPLLADPVAGRLQSRGAAPNLNI